MCISTGSVCFSKYFKTSKKVAVLCIQLPNKVQETQVEFQSLAANTVGINLEDTGNCVHKLCILL